MSTLKEFFEGFKLKDYTVELAREPVKQFLTVSSVKEILKLSESLLLSHIRFGISDYHFEKVDEPIIEEAIRREETSKSFTKVRSETHPYTYQKEIHVSSNIFMILIDQKLWKLSIDAYLICETPYIEDHEAVLTNYLVRYINALLSDTNFIKPVSLYNNRIEYLVDYQLLRSRRFTGYVKTYGDQSILNEIGFDNYLPKEEEKTQILVREDEESINEISNEEESPIMIKIVKTNTSSSEPEQDIKVIN